MKNRIQSYIKFIIYMIAIVLINVAGITLFFRMDLTDNRIYSISKASQRVVSTLSEPLTIKVFFSKDLPAPHNNTERYLHDLLEEYSIHGNRYFNYRFYDVSLDEGGLDSNPDENQQIATNYGIYPVQIQNIEKDEVKFQKAYMGLVIIHGDMIEKIPTITSTDGLEYKLTTSIQKLNNKISALLNLKENIKIKLFLSSSLETIAPYVQLEDLSSIPDELEQLVEKLNAKTFGRLSFEFHDPSKDMDLESEVEKYDILNLNWPAIPEKKIEPGSGSVGLVMEYQDKATTIPIVNVMRVPLFGTQYSMADMNEMEEIINQNIESLIDINEDIGYLADHGTLEVSPPSMMNPMQQQQSAISNFRNLVSQNYTIRDINLKDSTIPDNFNCLIVAGAKEPFSDYELFQIDQHLMRGKSLALFLDAFNEVTPPNNQPYAPQRPQFVPINTGLEKLLKHYGISIKKSYVMDENCFRQMANQQMGGGETPVYFAPIIKDAFIDNDIDFMKGIKELVVLKASPLELDEKRIEEHGLEALKLFASSEKSWEMSGRINLNPRFIHPPPSDEMQSAPLAYMLEGEFPSYFAGKPIPEKETDEADEEKDENTSEGKPDETQLKIEGKGEVITKGKPGRIFLLGTSDVLKNNMIDAEGMSTNATFILNVLDALNGRNEIAVMRSKEQRFNPLAETGPAVKTFIKAFNIAGLPVLVVAFGLIVLFRRHSRQKNIRLMFQK
jgi:ABC-2 type transport system permease protein